MDARRNRPQGRCAKRSPKSPDERLDSGQVSRVGYFKEKYRISAMAIKTNNASGAS